MDDCGHFRQSVDGKPLPCAMCSNVKRISFPVLSSRLRAMSFADRARHDFSVPVVEEFLLTKRASVDGWVWSHAEDESAPVKSWNWEGDKLVPFYGLHAV